MGDFYLDDRRWALISQRLPGAAGAPGCRGRDNRLFVEAVLWIARTGSPWRSLPPQFGKWYTAYTRFRRWSEKRVWVEVFARLAQDGRCEYFYEDGVVRHAPPRAAGVAESGDPEAVGGARGFEENREPRRASGGERPDGGARFARPRGGRFSPSRRAS